MSLVEQYLDLVNSQLPQAVQKERYPVRLNHCFARIILDNICGCQWYQVIEKPAYKHISEEQLRPAIALGQTFLNDPQACFAANEKSLHYRGKR